MPSKNQSNNTHYQKLKDTWLIKHSEGKKKLHTNHKNSFDWLLEKFPDRKKLASSAVGALMMGQVLPGAATLSAINNLAQPNEYATPVNKRNELMENLTKLVPDQVRPLNDNEEKDIAKFLSEHYKLDIKPEIDGKRLNRTYGLIGAEQHLIRYPGDTMQQQLPGPEANNHFYFSSGMAPGRGAWGYFANSKSELTQKDIDREKWYIAVQTFEAPGYMDKLVDYRGFFKYRKMLVVNPKTGHAIVTDIADSGPAVFTGKHLGGSPEVMYHLDLHKGSRKGAVLYFFINDPDDKIPLGPIFAQQ